MNAMPLIILTLALFVIAYKFYYSFIAAKVAVLDDSRETPAHKFYDGHNYYPMSKWVLFGHHFAAIAGAGPLVGPVLAAQFGFFPGFLWLLLGVVIAGAVQDFIIFAASVRHDGKSLAEIAKIPEWFDSAWFPSEVERHQPVKIPVPVVRQAHQPSEVEGLCTLRENNF